MRMMSALSRFGLLFLGFVLLSVVSADEVWRTLHQNLSIQIILQWTFLETGACPSFCWHVDGNGHDWAYLVRDERIENLEWESKEVEIMIDPAWISGLSVILFILGLWGAFTRKKCHCCFDVLGVDT